MKTEFKDTLTQQRWDAESVSIVRPPYLAEQILIAGGLPACGKSLFTAVLGSMKRVEIQKYNYTVDYICSLLYLGKIDLAAATTMIRMLTDIDLYNMMMSREINFRPSDMSSIFKNPRPWRYVLRLFQAGDARAVVRMKRTRPILHVLSHYLLFLSPPMFKALGDRLRVVEIVRHPLYMIKQWFIYMDRYGNDARDFTICFDWCGRSLPFFARGWEDQYVASNTMDKVIYTLIHCFRRMEEVFNGLSEEERGRLLIIPFERFVLDPWPYMKQIERLLDTRVTRSTLRELKKQRVPRKMIADGRNEAIYRLNGWQPPKEGGTEAQELADRRAFAKQYASSQALHELDQLSSWYESHYLVGSNKEIIK